MIFFLLVLTIIPFVFSYKDRIYSSIDKLPEFDIVCLLGAKVYPGNMLSPVAKQRCNTLIELYKIYRVNNKKLTHIYVSGTLKYEVDHLSDYLIINGIDEKIITRDYLGYDSYDSVRHIKKTNFKKILFVSQTFHLYRVIDMALSEKLNPYGLASEKIIPANDNISIISKYFIRLTRHYKNSFLFLLFKIKLYDKFSREAEIIENSHKLKK